MCVIERTLRGTWQGGVITRWGHFIYDSWGGIHQKAIFGGSFLCFYVSMKDSLPRKSIRKNGGGVHATESRGVSYTFLLEDFYVFHEKDIEDTQRGM